MKYQIKSVADKSVLYEKEASSLKECVESAVKENVELKAQFVSQLDLGNFIGHSEAMQKIYKLIKKLWICTIYANI